jgi:hypothetical protein
MAACTMSVSGPAALAISSAVVAAIGNGVGFSQGLDFGAWSSGDRTRQ